LASTSHHGSGCRSPAPRATRCTAALMLRKHLPARPTRRPWPAGPRPPWPALRALADRRAARVVGSPHDTVGISVRAPVARDLAASVATVTGSPSATTERCGGRAETRATAPGGAGEERLAVLQPAGVQQLRPGGEHGLTGGRRDACGADRRERGAVAVPEPELGDLGRAARRRAGRGRRPSRRRARAAPGRRASRWCRAGPRSNGRCRPSQSTKVPAFSHGAATGSTTSARSVTADARSSRLTTNGAASMRGERGSGSGRSRVDCRRRHAHARRCARRRDAAVSRPRAGSESTPQAVPTRPARRRRPPPAAGSTVGGRRPRRRALPRAAGPTRAGAVARQRGHARERPGPAASPDPRPNRRRSTARRWRPGVVVRAQPSSTSGSVPERGQQGAGELSRPGRNGASEQTGWPWGRPCADRRNRIGATRPRARGPGSRTDEACSRSSYVTPRPVRRPCGREDRTLLVPRCGRARKSMSLVPSTIRAQLGVAVGVLGRSLGLRPGRRGGLAAASATGAMSRASSRTSAQLAVSPRTSGVVRRSCAGGVLERPPAPCRSSTPR
jgi:hypothetical protein